MKTTLPILIEALENELYIYRGFLLEVDYEDEVIRATHYNGRIVYLRGNMDDSIAAVDMYWKEGK